jgi:radical SAM superfamily enzyme YgiQ (UPF0313 family)
VDLNDTGLGYIAAACKKAGADVTLMSWNINLGLEDFKQKLLELRPDIVGLKVFTTMFNEAYETLRCVRETLPNAIRLIGGPHPSTSRPEDLFAEFGMLLDFAIAGDGEYGMTELIDRVRVVGGKPSSEALSNVPGLIYRSGNEIVSNELYFDSELDTLAPMDWALQQPAWFGTNHGIDKTSIGALIMDSRGCPAQCGFCRSGKINGSKPRHRNIKRLCAEIEELAKKYCVRALVFTGNAFMSDVDYVQKLCEWLINFGIPLRWSCTGSAYDHYFRDPKLLKIMAKAGCNLIHFGIESGNRDVRERLEQPVVLETYEQVVKLTVDNGIRAAGYFMFGFPDETTKEMDDTIKYAFSLPFSSRSFMICLPLPGTSSYEAVLQQQGCKRIDWKTYDFSNPKLLPSKASPRQVRFKLFEAKVLRKSRFARRLSGLAY